MNKKEWLEIQKTNKEYTLPFITFPFVKKLDMTVEELVKNSNKQAELISYIAEKYPTNSAIGLMDLSVEAEAFGAEVRFFKMDVPTIIGSIIHDIEEVNNLTVPSPFDGRTGDYIKSISLLKKRNLNKLIFPGVIGPYSLAGRLFDMTELMVNCYTEPELVEELLKKTTEFIISYVKAFKDAGANGIVMAEPAAGLLSPELCEKFSSNYVNQIIEAVVDDNFVFVYHNCGQVTSLIENMKSIKADIFHFGDSIDIQVMLENMPSDKIIMGNISPVKIIKDGTKQEVKLAVESLLDKCNRYENFIISTGCDVPPLATIENIEAYFNAIQDYYKKH